MELDLRAIFTGEVKCLEVNKEFDMSQELLDGVYPLKSPVKILGTIKNSADVVKLKARVTAFIVKDCDRCCKETQNEYNVDIIMQPLPYQFIRWIENEDIDVKKLDITSDTKRVQDLHGKPLLLFSNSWNINWALEHNKDLRLADFSRS